MTYSRSVKRLLSAGLGLAGLTATLSAFSLLELGRRPRSAVGHPAAPVTYAKDVAPILQRNCLVCHRKGEVAPFGLETFEQAKSYAKVIKQATAARQMPPWKAESHGEFLDERRLTDAEISTVAKWVDAGTPLGDKRLIPVPPAFPVGWKIGKPDAVFAMPQSYTVGPEGRDVYRCFVAPTSYTEDKWISALEVAPGNAKVVHHVIAYLDTSGMARKLDARDADPGYSTHGSGPGFIPSAFIGGWAPGNQPTVLADGHGIFVPKGADVVLEVHYHKNGKTETDLTRMGVKFASKPIEKRVRILAVINPMLRIPPGKADYEVTAAAPIHQDITLLGLTPHMHLLGRTMTVTASLTNNETKQLVHVPDWDFKWQTTYAFRNPVKVPSGSSIRLKAVYDNSTGNPRNPSSPPKLVTWGEETTDEMCIAFVGYTVDSEKLTKGIKGGRASLFELGGFR